MGSKLSINNEDMKKKLGLAVALIFAGIVSGQTIVRKDPVIEKMVNAVNADSLRSNVRKLVSFGT